MKRLLILLVALLVTVELRASHPLTDYVDDKGFLYLRVPSVPALRKGFANSPFGKTAADAKVKAYFAPMLENIKFAEWDEQQKTKTGIAFADLLERFQGEGLLVVHLLPGATEPDGDGILLVQVKASEDELTRWIGSTEELAKEEKKKKSAPASDAVENSEEPSPEPEEGSSFKNVDETEKIAGVTVHVRVRESKVDGEMKRSDVTAWAYVDGIWVFSGKRKSVGDTVTAIKAGGVANSFSKSDLFLTSNKEHPGQALSLWFNAPPVISVLKDTAIKASAGKPANPFVSIPDMFRASGAEALQSFQFGVKFDSEQDEFYSSLKYTEPKGLLGLFAFRNNPIPKPAFISDKFVAVSVNTFSIAGAYESIETMLKDYNPGVHAMATGFLTTYTKNLGFDIKRDFVGALGDEISIATLSRQAPVTPDAGLPVEAFYSVLLANPKGFADVLATIENKVDPENRGLISKRDFMGYSIHTSNLPGKGQAQQSVAYAVVNNQLFVSVGSATAIELAIRTWKNSEPTIWQRKDVKLALEDIPSDAVGFSFQDNRAMVAVFLNVIEQVQKTMDAKGGDGKRMVDPSQKPSVEELAQYWADSYGWARRDATGIYSKSIIHHRK